MILSLVLSLWLESVRVMRVENTNESNSSLVLSNSLATRVVGWHSCLDCVIDKQRAWQPPLFRYTDAVYICSREMTRNKIAITFILYFSLSLNHKHCTQNLWTSVNVYRDHSMMVEYIFWRQVCWSHLNWLGNIFLNLEEILSFLIIFITSGRIK